jgi:hypothetical protein
MRLTTGLERATIARFGLVALVAAVAVTLRLYQLGQENFWIDEVHQIRVASQPASEIVKNYRPGTPYGTTDQAPLSMLVTHAFLSEKNPEWSARLPSAVSGALGVVVLFWLARQFLGFQPALLASLLLAISPLDVWYSQEARWYELWGLMTAVSYLALLRAEKQPSSRPAWWLFGLASAASLYTFVYSVFIMLSQGASLLWRALLNGGSCRAVRVFFSLIIIVFLAGAPVVYMVIGNIDDAHSGTLRSLSGFEIPYTLCAFSVGFTLGPTTTELHSFPGPYRILSLHPEVFLVALVFGPLILWGLWKITQDRNLRTWVVPWLVVPPASALLTAILFPAMTYQMRYAFASLPAFLLVLAVGVTSLRRPVRVAALGAVIALSAVSLENFYWSDRYDKEDARGAVAYLRSEDTDETQIVAVGQISDAMYFYAKDPAINVIRGCGRDTWDEDSLVRTRRVWLMCGRDWDRDCAPCLAKLARDYIVAEQASFVGVNLWRLDPKESNE